MLSAKRCLVSSVDFCMWTRVSTGKYGSRWKQGRWEMCNQYCGLIAEGLHMQPLHWHSAYIVHDRGVQARTRFHRFILRLTLHLG